MRVRRIVNFMRISIGIFAHNEEKHIGRTLSLLAQQDLFRLASQRGDILEVVTVANGCKDATAASADAANALLRIAHPGVESRTEVIAEPGKSNAWNMYVHRFSDPMADFLIFMDADITIVGEQTLCLLLNALLEDQKAHVSMDMILKDLAIKHKRSLVERVSLSATRLNQTGPPKLAGSLYCGRAQVIRRIWMPKGLLVEDGFLKAMIATDQFTQAEDLSRLVQVPAAAHTFEAVTKIRSIFKHEVRLLIGTWMNVILFGHLREMVAETERPAGCLIRDWNTYRPGWFHSLLNTGNRNPEFRRFSRTVIALPLRQALRENSLDRLKKLPIACLRSTFTCFAIISARNRIKQQVYQW